MRKRLKTEQSIAYATFIRNTEINLKKKFVQLKRKTSSFPSLLKPNGNTLRKEIVGCYADFFDNIYSSDPLSPSIRSLTSYLLKESNVIGSIQLTCDQILNKLLK